MPPTAEGQWIRTLIETGATLFTLIYLLIRLDRRLDRLADAVTDLTIAIRSPRQGES